jgi:hypothetical protein
VISRGAGRDGWSPRPPAHGQARVCDASSGQPQVPLGAMSGTVLLAPGCVSPRSSRTTESPVPSINEPWSTRVVPLGLKRFSRNPQGSERIIGGSGNPGGTVTSRAGANRSCNSDRALPALVPPGRPTCDSSAQVTGVRTRGGGVREIRARLSPAPPGLDCGTWHQVKRGHKCECGV